MHKLSNSPTAAESKVIEDKKNHDDWAKQGNNTPAHNKPHPNPAVANASHPPVLTQTSEPGAIETKKREVADDLANWGR